MTRAADRSVDAVAAAPARYALEVHDLSGPMERPVLRHVSLTVGAGETHVVVGAMHSGKSLLLRLILGLQRARHGRVAIDGSPFDAAAPNEDHLRRLRPRVGVVFDSSALVSRLTLLENAELPLVEHTSADAAEARETAAELLREVGVVGDIDRTPDRVSRLDRRRAALARALVLEPVILLVDEPGHGLDADAAAELDETLARLQLRYRCAALICSQEVRYAFRFPNAVSVLAGGTLVDHGDIDQLRHSGSETVRRLDRKSVV